MLRWFIAVIGALFLTTSAWADGTIDSLTNATSLTGTENVPIFQTANPAVKTTTQAIANLKAAVTSIATSCGAAGGTITATGTIKVSETTNAQTGTSYTTQTSDCGKLVTQSNASASAITLLAPATAGAGFWHDFTNIGAGTATLTPAVGTINGNASLALTTGQGARIVTDGTNYFAVLGQASGGGGTPVIFVGTATNVSNAYSIASTTPGGFTLTDQFIVRFKAPAGNTGASTLNIASTGATAIEKQVSSGLAALTGGEIVSGLEYDATYQATCTCFVLLNSPSSAVTTGVTSGTVGVAEWTNWGFENVSSAAITRTLPASATLAANGGVAIAAIGNSVTLALASGSDQINGGTAGASVTIASGVTTFVTSDGAGHFFANPLTAGGGGGTVTTTGTPASGNLSKFSGATSITNADLTGDVTTSGTTATTIANNAVTLAKQATNTANTLQGFSNTGAAADVAVGSGLSLSGGTLSATGGGAPAFSSISTGTNTTAAMTVGTGASMGFSGSGSINASEVAGDANVSFLDVNQSYTKGQAVTPDSATSCGTQSAGGTMTPNFANSNSCLATFGAGNLTIANPTNVKAGQPYVIALTQDATGGRTVTWGANYKFAGGTKPTLSTGANAKDIISCWADTTTTINCTLAVANAS